MGRANRPYFSQLNERRGQFQDKAVHWKVTRQLRTEAQMFDVVTL